MAVNNMSVGKDYSFAYYDTDSGQIVDLGDVQSVNITAQKHDIKSMPYNDVPRYGYIPDGYKIDFTVTRTASTLEDFQLAANTRFNSGNSTKAGFLNEVVRNPDDTYSRYQYTGFVFWVTGIGEISREKSIAIKAEGWASDKIRIA